MKRHKAFSLKLEDILYCVCPKEDIVLVEAKKDICILCVSYQLTLNNSWEDSSVTLYATQRRSSCYEINLDSYCKEYIKIMFLPDYTFSSLSIMDCLEIGA